MRKRRYSKATVFCFVLLLSLLLVCDGASAFSRVEPAWDFDVIVIGAGLGGLAAATHLALNDYKVLVLEQHDKVGGCAICFEREDFIFDASLHEMAGGGPGKMDRGLYELLALWGIHEKVAFIELPQFYRSVFPGVDIRLPSNWEGFKDALQQQWPAESEGIDRFQRLCGQTYDDMMELKDLYRYGSVKAFFVKLMVPLRQRTFFKYMDKTLQDVMDDCFENEDLKAVVSQLWVYYGAPTPEQSALLGLMATEGYLGDGVWHFKGTSQALSNAYAERIRELGGEIQTGALVTRVIMENGSASGVETQDGAVYTARYIVANTDPYQLAFKLVGEEHFPAKYINRLHELKPANSLFGVYMGLNIDLAELGYQDTEIFYQPNTSNARTLHDTMMRGDFRNGAVSITIYSNYGDPIYAPKGKSLVTLTAYSDMDIWPEYGDAYDAFKEKKVTELVELAAELIPELADPECVAVKEGFTPRTLERFTLNKKGVVYGFYLSPEQWEKLPNRTPISNLFIASNWTQVWHGMTSAQINGWQAAQLIIDGDCVK
jgi:phytoene dehydrogenase-like protein